MEMSTTNELTRLSGVSRSTVYRFLRGEGVRPKAREQILQAMQRLNIQHENHSVHKGSTLLISIRQDFKSFKGYGLSISGFISRAEAFGTVLLEAMACGLPCVSTELGTGTSWVVQSGKTGWVVPPENPLAMAEALKRLLDDPDMRRDMGSAGRQRVLDRFTRDRMIDGVMNVYRTTLDRPKGARFKGLLP